MTTMFTNPIPSQSSSVKTKYRTLTSQFGDGYTATALDGINSEIATYSLVFENISSAQASIVETFIHTVKSNETFDWIPTGESTTKYWRITADGYTKTAKSGNIYTITFDIEQVY